MEEKRLVGRVFRHWTETSTAKRFASKGDIYPLLLGDDWANCALIRLDPQLDQSIFVVVGEKLLSDGDGLTDSPITACRKESLLGTMVRYLSRFQPSGGPLGIVGTADHRGARVLFRAVLLPLSSDGGHLDHVLGAANFRAVRAGEDKELRTRLQVAMLRVEEGQIWDVYSPTWGGWVQAKVTAVEGDRATLRQKGSMHSMALKANEMIKHPERYRFVSYS